MVNSVSLPDASLQKQKSRKKRVGLFLKFGTHSDENVGRAKEILSSHKGSLPLYFYFEDTRKYEIAPQSNFVATDDALINELKSLLGESNVAVII